ncbi:hypothetical protein BJX61DRAFT_529024 [Aspergillus egyptiacus]|nr:hypothetical protein BJX61DRAFT_529024 [Aspergillus egyptiacus]
MELADQERSSSADIFSPVREGTTSRPRSDLRYRQILLDADEFTTKYELDDVRTEIRAAALMLDDPDDIGRVEGLTEGDVAALRLERRPPPIFSRIIVDWWWSFPRVCTIGGILWGFIEQLPSPLIPEKDFSPDPPSGRQTVAELMRSGLPTIACCIIGVWCAVPMLRYSGRRVAACRALALKSAGLVGGLAFRAAYLRVLAGVLSTAASGMVYCTIPMYLAETSPSSKRGSVLLTWYLSQRVGILFSAVGSQLSGDDTSALAYWLMMLLPVALGACFWNSPESPYWYTRQGEMREAYKALREYRDSAVQTSRDLYRIYSFGTKETPGNKRGRRTMRRSLQALVNSTIFILAEIIPETLGFLMTVSMFHMGQNGGLEAYRLLPLLYLCLALILCIILLSITLIERVGRPGLVLPSMLLMTLSLFATKMSAPTYAVFNGVQYLGAPLTLTVPQMAMYLASAVYPIEISCSIGSEPVMATTLTIVLLKLAIVEFSAVRIFSSTPPEFIPNYCLGAPLSLFL